MTILLEGLPRGVEEGSSWHAGGVRRAQQEVTSGGGKLGKKTP